MRFHRQHEQTRPKEIETLVVNQSLGLLITSSGSKAPKTGLYNTIFKQDRFYLHLGRTDEQTADLRENNKCQFVFSESLSVIPSYWIDEQYGGAINQFFKFVEFSCTARIIEDNFELNEVMQKMMDHYQSEKNYVPLDPNHEVYRDKYKMICAVELKINATRTKWNLGQTKPESARKNILKQLKIRSKSSDLKTAFEIEKWEGLT